MSDNRTLNGLNWQERNDGAWYAETKNYRLLVYKQSPEDIVDFAKDYLHQAIVYKWHEDEQVWILVHKPMWGVKGSLENAKIAAEEMLALELEKQARRIDPGQAIYDALQRIIGNAQGREMEMARELEAIRAQRDDPRMRGLPPGHPPIRRRGDMEMGRSFERQLEKGLFNPTNFDNPPNPPLPNRELDEQFRKLIKERMDKLGFKPPDTK